MSGSASYYDRIMSGEATPEPEVQAAMAWVASNYRETGDPYDWVPVAVASVMYRTSNPRHPLSSRAFGFALHLAFPDSESCVRRMRTGHSARGRVGIVGLGSERSVDHEEWGKRRKRGSPM